MISLQEYKTLSTYKDLLDDWKAGKCVTVVRAAYLDLEPIAHAHYHRSYSLLCRGCILSLLRDCHSLYYEYRIHLQKSRKSKNND